MSSFSVFRADVFDQDINRQHCDGAQKRPLSDPDAAEVPIRPRGRPRLTEEQRLTNQSQVLTHPRGFPRLTEGRQLINQREHDEQRQHIKDEEEEEEEDMHGDEDDAAAFQFLARGLILPA